MKKAKEVIVSLLKKVIYSFENSKRGFSARKLSAFAAMNLVFYIDKRYLDSIEKTNDYSFIPDLVMYHLLFVLTCLGIVTFEEITKMKNGQSKEKEDDKVE